METVQIAPGNGTVQAPRTPSAPSVRPLVALFATLTLVASVSAQSDESGKLSPRTQSAILNAVLASSPARADPAPASGAAPETTAEDSAPPVTLEKLVVEGGQVPTVGASAARLELKSPDLPRLNVLEGGAIYQPAWARGRLVAGAWKYFDLLADDSRFSRAGGKPTAKWDLIRVRW